MRLWQGLEVFDEDSPNRQLMPERPRPLIEGGKQSGGQSSGGGSSDEGSQDGRNADSGRGETASASPVPPQGLEGAVSEGESETVSGGANEISKGVPPAGKEGDLDGGVASPASPALDVSMEERTPSTNGIQGN